MRTSRLACWGPAIPARSGVSSSNWSRSGGRRCWSSCRAGMSSAGTMRRWTSRAKTGPAPEGRGRRGDGSRRRPLLLLASLPGFPLGLGAWAWPCPSSGRWPPPACGRGAVTGRRDGPRRAVPRAARPGRPGAGPGRLGAGVGGRAGGPGVAMAVPASRQGGVRQDEVQHAAVDVDVGDPDDLAVAQPVPAARNGGRPGCACRPRGNSSRRPAT